MSVILVTGCSSGFGLSAAVALAKRGETVVASMRDLSRASKLRDSAGDTKLGIIQLDVTDARSRHAAVSTVTTQYGQIDVLINNAGVFSMGPTETLGEADLRSHLRNKRLRHIRIDRTWCCPRCASDVPDGLST